MEMKNIAEHKIYNIIKVKNKHGFRLLLRFDDGQKKYVSFQDVTLKKTQTLKKKR